MELPSASSELALNGLLRDLPESEARLVAGHLARVRFKAGQVLHDPGERVGEVFFVVGGLVALTTSLEDGRAAELAVVGHDGAVGVDAVLGGRARLVGAVAVLPVRALGLSRRALAELLPRCPVLTNQLLHYMGSLMAQMSQIAACNRFHAVPQRYARWLLVLHAYGEGVPISMTQERLSGLLSARRQGIAEAARVFSDARLVKYGHGTIVVNDPALLSREACECYRIILAELNRRQARAATKPPRERVAASPGPSGGAVVDDFKEDLPAAS